MKTKKHFFTAIIAVCATSVLNLSCSQAEEAMVDLVDEASTESLDKEAVENADILMGVGVHDSEDPVIVSTMANSDVISFDSLMAICKEEFTEWSSGAKKRQWLRKAKHKLPWDFRTPHTRDHIKYCCHLLRQKHFQSLKMYI